MSFPLIAIAEVAIIIAKHYLTFYITILTFLRLLENRTMEIAWLSNRLLNALNKLRVARLREESQEN